MPVLWLTQLAFLIFNIILVVLFVVASRDFCGSVFETQVDYVLIGHVMAKADVADEFECQLKCMANNSCKSCNVHPGGDNANRICELNNKTRQMKPGDLKPKKGSTYYGSVEVSCIDVTHDRNGKTNSGQCHPGYQGARCETPIRGFYYNQPAHSCKDIRDSGISQKDGEYWIDPEKNGNPFKVFCDMTTDGGGWLLVSNVVIDNPSSQQFSVESSYLEISNCHNNKTFLTTSAMKELRTHLSFTQLRFHCSKRHGRTFHVTTANNSTGEAVVQYFSGQTDVRPNACCSFVRMKDENSRLAGACQQWAGQKWVYRDGRKGSLYHVVAYVSGLYHWLLTPGGSRWECDDYLRSGYYGLSSGDFWKVYVR